MDSIQISRSGRAERKRSTGNQHYSPCSAGTLLLTLCMLRSFNSASLYSWQMLLIVIWLIEEEWVTAGAWELPLGCQSLLQARVLTLQCSTQLHLNQHKWLELICGSPPPSPRFFPIHILWQDFTWKMLMLLLGKRRWTSKLLFPEVNDN